jgi:hypothetical protein
MWDVIEHRRDRHAQDSGDFVRPSRASTVYTALIFLNLLRGDARLPREAILAHFHRSPSIAHLFGEMHIDSVELLGGVGRTFFTVAEPGSGLGEIHLVREFLAMQAIFDLFCRQ